MKDYSANLSETFGNVFKSSDDHSVTYVTPTNDFWVEISLGILGNAGRWNV